MLILSHAGHNLETPSSRILLLRKGQRHAVFQERNLIVVELDPERVANIIHLVEAPFPSPDLPAGQVCSLTQHMQAITLNEKRQEIPGQDAAKLRRLSDLKIYQLSRFASMSR